MISEEGLEFRSRVLQRETLWGVGVSQSWSCLKKKRQRGNLKMSILDANPIVFDHVCVPSPHIFKLIHWQEVSIIHIQNVLVITKVSSTKCQGTQLKENSYSDM